MVRVGWLRMTKPIDIFSMEFLAFHMKEHEDEAPFFIKGMGDVMAEGQVGILVAEDETDICNLLAMILRAEGFLVFEARDGLEAFEIFKAHADEIALLITDLGLPGLGGVELIEKAKQIKPSVKVIGASGFGRNNVREEVMKAGGHEFLPKPYVAADLVATARKLLASQ